MYSWQRPKCCLSSLVLSILLLADFFSGVASEEYLCDCTEIECRMQGQIMCRTEQGCYKEYYNKYDPPITMGCVRSPLYCEHTKMKPVEIENEAWPYTECCYSELCNRQIQIPDHITKNKRISPTTSTQGPPLVPIEQEMTTPNNELMTSETPGADNSESDVHPVFLLLIILVVVFLIVVVASILVIIKIWLYKRQKSVEIKCYKSPREKTDSYTQTAYLLAYQNSSSPTSSQSHHGLNQPLYDVP